MCTMTTMVSTAASLQAVNINTQRISEKDVIAKIGDVIRGSLIANKLERIPVLIDFVAKQITNHGGQYYIKNFWNDQKQLSLGYVGVHIKIRMPLIARDKYILMELQIHAKEIMDGTDDCAKEIAHRLYKMPGEATEEKVSPDVISSSQLVYLTSMTKLLCTKEELKRVVNTLDVIQSATKIDGKMRLVLETAMLLQNAKLGEGIWSEELQAVVPSNRDAVAAAWMDTAAKINKMLDLKIAEQDKHYSWTNTAATVDELYTDAYQIKYWFQEMCEEAAYNFGGCIVNFGPGNKHMIKEKKSLQDKIKKDIKLLSNSTTSPQSPPLTLTSESQPMSQPVLPSQKEAYVRLLIQHLDHPAVKGDASLRTLLDKQVQELMHQTCQTLTVKHEESYVWLQKLLINQQLSEYVSKSLHKILESEEKHDPATFHMPATTSVFATPRTVSVVPAMAFGAAQWNKYFGDVGVEPPLPYNIEQILNSPCPFTSANKWNPFGSVKTIRETHLLTLIPKTVDGKSFTLNSIDMLVKRPKQGFATQCRRYWDGIKKQYGDSPIQSSYWVLFTKDVIAGSRNKSYDDQKQLVADYKRKTSMPYEMPKMLEAATSIFMAYVQTGVKLYNRDNTPWTYTRCQEKCAMHPDWPLVVGGFSSDGLNVYDCKDFKRIGVGGVWVVS